MPREFFGVGDALVERVAQDDIAENQHDHARKQQCDCYLQHEKAEFDYADHSLLPASELFRTVFLSFMQRQAPENQAPYPYGRRSSSTGQIAYCLKMY